KHGCWSQFSLYKDPRALGDFRCDLPPLPFVTSWAADRRPGFRYCLPPQPQYELSESGMFLPSIFRESAGFIMRIGALRMTTKLHKYSSLLKRILPPVIWQPARALLTGIITPIRFSQKTGHWKSSLRMSACSSDGTPIPWYTYPAIDFLAQRNFEDRNVLELGGGQSTLWWSMRARSVLTIEDNSDWYAWLNSQIGANVALHHLPFTGATETI